MHEPPASYFDSKVFTLTVKMTRRLQRNSSSVGSYCLVFLWQVGALLVLSQTAAWSGSGLITSAGEQRKAAVVNEQQMESGGAEPLNEATVKAFCKRQGLPSFMVPRRVFVQHTPLPANASGKVLKHVVREHLITWMSRRAQMHSRL